MPAIRRWLSAATPPEPEFHPLRTPAVGASHPHTHLLYPRCSGSEEPRQTGLAASTGPIVFSGRLKPQRTILRGRGNPLSLSSPNAGRCRPRCPHPALFFSSPTVPLPLPTIESSVTLASRRQRHSGSLPPQKRERARGRSQPRLKVQAGVARVARVPRHPRPAPLSFERVIRPAARLAKRIQIAER